MLIVGLVGGVASGKSRVARYLQKLGAEVLDADQIGHQVLLQDGVKQKLVDRWGAAVTDPRGEIDRSRIVAIVFGSSSLGSSSLGSSSLGSSSLGSSGIDSSSATELRFLESVVHPQIGECLQAQLEAAGDRGCSVIVLDAPVMFKAGWERFCDEILFVEADERSREARAALRGWNRETLLAREAAQTPLVEKRARSTRIVDNSGDWESTRRQLDQFWEDWSAGA